jgi:hydrogenase expression/formation protein HypE
MSNVLDRLEAESILRDLAAVFARGLPSSPEEVPGDPPLPNLEAKYRTLIEQLPAVVFMEAIRAVPGGHAAVIIGEVREEPQAAVLAGSRYGGTRIVDMLVGDPLPRIC